MLLIIKGVSKHSRMAILAIENLIFNQTFSVNFRLNKCNSHTKISDYFGSYLLALIKKVLLFLTYVPVTSIKSKLQIHPANPTNPDILKFFTKFSYIKRL